MYPLTLLVCLAATCHAGQADLLRIPWAHECFSADEGCSWLSADGVPEPAGSANYLAPPQPGEDWRTWLEALREYRTGVRAHLWDADREHIRLEFDGVRAWVRTGRAWAFAANLQPGEEIVLEGEARAVSGNRNLCAAFDWCDRPAGQEGPQLGWSTVVGTVDVGGGEWRAFRLPVRVPAFDSGRSWARPIFGMDGTHDGTRSIIELRGLRLAVPRTPARAAAFEALGSRLRRGPGFDDALYARPDLRWSTRNFVCGFIMGCDRQLWDPEAQEYRVAQLCRDATRDFGGYDSVVLWHAYPRIGADERNQFDLLRDMPGGLAGLKEVVAAFHARRVRVFIAYNPWDVGTRREGRPDEEVLAEVVRGIEADGLFLDTMGQSQPRLREVVDAARPGVCFEPEGQPPVEGMEHCTASWAQFGQPFDGMGVLRLKWIEPRHMQHQISRWSPSHREELTAAWLNGSGILVWENVFGSWNGWGERDRARLRRMAPVWRCFAELLCDGDAWRPCFPTGVDGTVASLWEREGERLWTLANRGGDEKARVTLDRIADGMRCWDLWTGTELASEGGRVTVSVGEYAAVYASHSLPSAVRGLLARQRREARRPWPGDAPEEHPSPLVTAGSGPAVASAPAGFLPVPAGEQDFVVRHVRRECGCYPDPGTPPQRAYDFLRGYPFSEPMEHRVHLVLRAFSISADVVTNREYEGFLRATGYRPRCPDRFLAHWGGPQCPAAVLDEPVTCVDLDDARAYAKWAGMRLPTEWEWHRAAQMHGAAFQRGRVWEWTDATYDDGHTRFAILRGGCRWQAQGSAWYFPGGDQPVETHAKFLLMAPGFDRCTTVGFRCAAG